MRSIYTIGHSNYDSDYFMALLFKFKVNTVVDVRSVPFSKYVPHFNKDNIKRLLNNYGIHHVYMGEELGIIRNNPSILAKEGYVDFDKVSETAPFQSGITRIIDGLSKGYTIIIMCTEKDPIDCHRSILIGRELHKKKYDIVHILTDGSMETHTQFEGRLLNMYFPLKMQQDLFSIIEPSKSEEEILNKAYNLRNRDIGYRPKE
jgi:uncharacterized protein (DUF488 family)